MGRGPVFHFCDRDRDDRVTLTCPSTLACHLSSRGAFTAREGLRCVEGCPALRGRRQWHESVLSPAFWRNTGHVCEALVLPATRPPPLPLPVRESRSARSSLSPASSHHRDGCQSVRIRTPHVPERRSGGRQSPRTCCLFTATPSAHKTGKSQDICAHAKVGGWRGRERGERRERRGVGPGGQAGPEEKRLAKEVKLTSLKISPVHVVCSHCLSV